MDRGAWRATQSMGSRRVGHNCATEHAHTYQKGRIWHVYVCYEFFSLELLPFKKMTQICTTAFFAVTNPSRSD